MNWFRRSIVSLALKSAQYVGGRSLSLTDPTGWDWGNGTYSGKHVDDESAMRVTAVWACNRVLAETVASLPGGIFERDSEGNMKKIDHELGEVLLESPNGDQTSPEYFEAKMTNQGLRGNAYSIVDRGARDRINSLTPVEACNTEVKRLDSGALQYRVNDRGRWETYPQEKIWHWKTFSRDGVVGLSPIGYARETMGLSMAQAEVAGKLYANGLHSSMTITVPEWIKDDKRAAVHLKLQQMYQGLANAGTPLILEGGMKADKAIMPFVDAQFAELMGMGVDDICRLYRVPPHMIAKLDRATFSNIEQQSLDFVMYTILPYLRRIEHSVSKWLIKPSERKRIFFRFNFEGLLRADSTARAGLYSILLQNGVLTRNEVRALENRNRLESDGMDEPTVQSNMALLEQLSQLVTSRNQPPRQEVTP